MASIVVDTVELVRNLVKHIESLVQKPLIFVDLEGVNLSRNGVVAIMQVLVPPLPVVHLIDVHTLRNEAFDVPASGGQSLRTILESKDYPKVFFDVRNDSDALYSHYQISLNGVIDLQLLEFASRSRKGRFIKGLAKCISEDGGLGWTSSQNWQRTKDAGQRLFAPEKGGSYEVFLERPLSDALVKYCVQDVLVLPKLLLIYAERLEQHLVAQIQAEVLRRVALSQSPTFNGRGRHMAVGPSFSWACSRHSTALDFPMILIGSKDLAERCALHEVAVAEADLTKALGTSEATDVLDSVENASTASTIDALLPTLASVEIDGPPTGWPVIEEASSSDGQENEVEQEGGLDNLGYESASDSRSGQDFTACSGSDCGWCGHCDY